MAYLNMQIIARFNYLEVICMQNIAVLSLSLKIIKSIVEIPTVDFF